jgi:hypothetical protein
MVIFDVLPVLHRAHQVFRRQLGILELELDLADVVEPKLVVTLRECAKISAL